MDIHSSLASLGYNRAKTATKPDAGPTSPNLSEQLKGAASDFTTVLQNGENTAKAAMTGNADPLSLVQAMAQSELAVETTVTIRNKVVEAYQEILRMPV
ncbi:MAG: flagellar hook-basal body complex protein FliE [Halocynthiibacter sp.]